MIKSMTGYAVAARELPHCTLNLELRSVNHRYLEILFKLPEEFRVHEPAMREAIGNVVKRGKLDLRLQVVAKAAGQGLSEINRALVDQLASLDRQVRELMPDARPLNVAEVLGWPGVVAQETSSAEAMQEALFGLLDSALKDLDATRIREGAKLKGLLLEKTGQMREIATRVAPHIPQIIATHQEKLAAALNEAGTSLNEERIRQEIALFAQRIDVDEELARLNTHLDEEQRILESGGASGKRLDFLMQELNREANTLGSKSVASEVSRAAMDLKILIEQMREQIQNIE
jgi:uncharacterized protein (TIGR00255 family)